MSSPQTFSDYWKQEGDTQAAAVLRSTALGAWQAASDADATLLADLREALRERLPVAHARSANHSGSFEACQHPACANGRALLAQQGAEGEDKPLTEAEELLGCRSFPACYTVPSREPCAVCAYFARRNASQQPAEGEADDKEWHATGPNPESVTAAFLGNEPEPDDKEAGK